MNKVKLTFNDLMIITRYICSNNDLKNLLLVNKRCNDLRHVYLLNFKPSFNEEFPILKNLKYENTNNYADKDEINKLLRSYYHSGIIKCINKCVYNQFKCMQCHDKDIYFVVETLDNYDDLCLVVNTFKHKFPKKYCYIIYPKENKIFSINSIFISDNKITIIKTIDDLKNINDNIKKSVEIMLKYYDTIILNE